MLGDERKLGGGLLMLGPVETLGPELGDRYEGAGAIERDDGGAKGALEDPCDGPAAYDGGIGEADGPDELYPGGGVSECGCARYSGSGRVCGTGLTPWTCGARATASTRDAPGEGRRESKLGVFRAVTPSSVKLRRRVAGGDAPAATALLGVESARAFARPPSSPGGGATRSLGMPSSFGRGPAIFGFAATRPPTPGCAAMRPPTPGCAATRPFGPPTPGFAGMYSRVLPSWARAGGPCTTCVTTPRS